MTTLPADAHVHSEWSWDCRSDPASAGSIGRTCERAVRIGLQAVVFSEHLDLEDSWRADEGDIGEHAQKYVDESGHVRLPPFDADGYLAAIDRCRHEYPELRILTGVELGQPHLWDAKAAALLSTGAIDRVNGSLHMLPFDNGEEGGHVVSFGSDAHGPDPLAANFPEAMAMVESFGFRPGSRPEDFWTR